jgi:hypothetical protein
MKLVVKIINQVRAHALQRRLFKALTDELNYQYGDLLLHTEIRWLSEGRVLRRFNEQLPTIVEFFKESDETYSEHTNFGWLRDFAFLVDVTEKLNELNVQLQGQD